MRNYYSQWVYVSVCSLFLLSTLAPLASADAEVEVEASMTAKAPQDDCRSAIIWLPSIGPNTDCTGDAITADVLVGTTFSSTNGVDLTGTMKNIGAVTLTPGTTVQNIPEGYHNGSGTVEGDPALLSSNIRKGTTIFGVPGDTNVVDTSPGNALQGDILDGKVAYVKGAPVTGNIITRNLSDVNDNVEQGYYEATTLRLVDPDLHPGNIKSGVGIFGQVGTLNSANCLTLSQKIDIETEVYEKCDSIIHSGDCNILRQEIFTYVDMTIPTCP